MFIFRFRKAFPVTYLFIRLLKNPHEKYFFPLIYSRKKFLKIGFKKAKQKYFFNFFYLTEITFTD